MSMRTLVIVLLGASLWLGGCRKKSAPQFYSLESTYSILVARDGDEAYADPAMDEVVQGLKAIAPETVEGPRAAKLLEAIGVERARLAAEQAEVARLDAAGKVPRPQLPSLLSPTRAATVDAGRAAVDAGQSLPWAEMPLHEFNRLFGRCMEPPAETELAGLGKVLSFAVLGQPTCREQFKVPDDTRLLYVFKDGVLRGERTERRTVTIQDAGVISETTVVDGGAPRPWLPGMPAPANPAQ